MRRGTGYSGNLVVYPKCEDKSGKGARSLFQGFPQVFNSAADWKEEKRLNVVEEHFVAEKIRILIAEDQNVVRSGLVALLEPVEGIEVVAEAADGVEAVLKTRAAKPDVILMDLMMPRKSGIEAIEDIKRENPDARILVLTSFSDDDKVFAAIKAGALGYLLKETTVQDLFQAIRDVYHGESSLHPAIARKLIRELNRPSTLPKTGDPLTEREVEVLDLVARGLSNQDIADKLVISERTVRTHVSNILGKLHLANRTQAALYALHAGLTRLDDIPDL